MAHTEYFSVTVNREPNADKISFTLDPDNMSAVVNVPDSAHKGPIAMQEHYRDVLMELTLNVIGHIVIMPDMEVAIDSLGDEGAFARALTFSVPATPHGIIFSTPFGKLIILTAGFRRVFSYSTINFPA